MGRQAWSIHIEDREHQVEVEHGYWFGAVTLRVDGNVMLRGRPLLDMSYDRGVDLPIAVDGHSLVVAIRPVFWRRTLLASGYRYALSVDGRPAPGSVALSPLVRRARRGVRSLNDFIEAVAWGAGGIAAARLLLEGPAIGSPIILCAPALVSLVVRRGNRLPGWLRLALATGVFAAGVLLSAAIVGALAGHPGPRL